jgi:phospholipase/carboxylesterase
LDCQEGKRRMMELSVDTIEHQGWMARQRIPTGAGPFPMVLMLHGLTGDENAMWVFAGRIPENAWVLAPRGLYPSPLGGYSWHPPITKTWPWMMDFEPAEKALLDWLTPTNFPRVDFTRLTLLGFSQGAALAGAIALSHPERITALAGLSGFLPEGAAALVGLQPLKDKSAFLAHGTRDELVPVERAREAVQLLQIAGAQTIYCEDDVGHKLSASCFRSLENFLKRPAGPQPDCA